MVKFIILIAGLALAAMFVSHRYSGGSKAIVTGSFVDSRDDKTYKTVKIGSHTWMSENLNYDASGSMCYDNEDSNCDLYGKLYDWATAKMSCPDGWHLPANAEWDALYQFIDSEYKPEDGYSVTTGKYLKAASGWNSNGNGVNSIGFAALPGGFGYSGGYYNDIGYSGFWWSASEDAASTAFSRNIYYYIDDAFYYSNYKSYLYSVRCVKD